jgi:nicotinamide phosphoribosyltransferase
MYNKQLLDESGFNGDSLEEAEYITYRDLLAKFPNGIMALVSDQFDYWAVISKHLPRLKNEIMQRDGKLVIRPDSADPVEVICGFEIKDYTNNKYVESLDEVEDDFAEYLQDQIENTTEFAQLGPSEATGIFKFNGRYYKMEIFISWNRLNKQFYFIDEDPEIESCEEIQLTPEQKGSIECLWDTFGGTYNEKGFKVLDSHIGLIYGDAITIPRLIQICERLKAKGFAISNVVFGVGAYSLNGSLTRDTFGQAFKATYCEIDGKAVNVYKEPKTDKSKSSAKGLLCVNYDEDTKNYSVQNECTWDQEEKSCLKTVFKDGKLLINEDFKVIRDRLGFIKEGK